MLAQVNSRQTPMFDLVPQTTNKQPTQFLFPPPTTLTTTHCHPSPPLPPVTNAHLYGQPLTTTNNEDKDDVAMPSHEPKSTWPRSTTMPPTQAPCHHCQQLPPTTITGHPQLQLRTPTTKGDNVAMCHVVQTVTMLAIVTVHTSR